MLRHCGVTRTLTVPVSAALLADASGYVRALTDYRQGYVETIICQFVNASFRAVNVASADQLERAEILQRTGGSRRNRVWIAPDVIDALDAFAERVGRRGY